MKGSGLENEVVLLSMQGGYDWSTIRAWAVRMFNRAISVPSVT
jgi:hypothetical protein